LTPSLEANHRQSVFLVFCCTLLGATAQVLIKMGAGSLGAHSSIVQTLISILTTRVLFAGYALYGVSTVLLILALRRGELSMLYPVIALTFVWVTILSVVIFHESMNALKLGGIATIVIGVAVLGTGAKR